MRNRKRAIPGTVVTNKETPSSDTKKPRSKKIPSTIVTQQNKSNKIPSEGNKRKIPATIVTNRECPADNTAVEKNKRKIPSTIVTNRVEKSPLSLSPPFETIKEEIPKTKTGQVQIFRGDRGTPLENVQEEIPSLPPTRRKYLTSLRQISDQKRHHLLQEETLVGATQGDIVLGDNHFLSSPHAKFYYYQNQLAVVDLGSTSGTYIRVRKNYQLAAGDVFTTGQQVFRFEYIPSSTTPNEKINIYPFPSLPPLAKLVYLIGQEEYDITLTHSQIVLGKDKGHLLFQSDNSLSASHAILVQTKGGFILQDLNSSSGTWLKIRRASILKPGDMIRLGDCEFIVEY